MRRAASSAGDPDATAGLKMTHLVEEHVAVQSKILAAHKQTRGRLASVTNMSTGPLDPRIGWEAVPGSPPLR